MGATIYPDADIDARTRGRAEDLLNNTRLGKMQAMVTAMVIEDPDITLGEVSDRLGVEAGSVRYSFSRAREQYEMAQHLVMSVDADVYARGSGGSPTHSD